MHSLSRLSFALVAVLFACTNVNAETITIGVGQQSSSVSMPHKGDSTATVQSYFGNPQTSYSPVGNPPITRWVFEQFTVYFEYDHVVHSVAHHSRSN